MIKINLRNVVFSVLVLLIIIGSIVIINYYTMRIKVAKEFITAYYTVGIEDDTNLYSEAISNFDISSYTSEEELNNAINSVLDQSLENAYNNYLTTDFLQKFQKIIENDYFADKLNVELICNNVSIKKNTDTKLEKQDYYYTAEITVYYSDNSSKQIIVNGEFRLIKENGHWKIDYFTRNYPIYYLINEE